MVDQDPSLKPPKRHPCVEGIGNVRKIIVSARQAPGPGEALQRIKDALPASANETVQERMEEIIEKVISQYFPKPKL